MVNYQLKSFSAVWEDGRRWGELPCVLLPAVRGTLRRYGCHYIFPYYIFTYLTIASPTAHKQKKVSRGAAEPEGFCHRPCLCFDPEKIRFLNPTKWYHHLSITNILLRIWNRKPDSAWTKLTTEIKKDGRNLYNFLRWTFKNWSQDQWQECCEIGHELRRKVLYS